MTLLNIETIITLFIKNVKIQEPIILKKILKYDIILQKIAGQTHVDCKGVSLWKTYMIN